MGVFKEIPKGDGSGVTTFYRLDEDLSTVEIGGVNADYNYENALNKPSINNVVLTGNKTSEDLGLQPAGDYLTEIPEDYVKFLNLGDGLSIDENKMISVDGDVAGAVVSKTGEEIANLDSTFNGVVLCTEEYNKYTKGSIYVVTAGRITGTIISPSTTGGIVFNTNGTTTVSDFEQNISVGDTVVLTYNFKSSVAGKGIAKLYYNNVLKSNLSISQGNNSFDVTQYIKNGTNTFTIEVTDANNSIIILDYVVNGVNLTLKSNFNQFNVYTSAIDYRYITIGPNVKLTYFEIDGEVVGTQTVRTTNEESSFILTGLTHGTHDLKVYSTMELNGVTVNSNVLEYKLIYAEPGNKTPIVSSTFNITESLEGQRMNIDYIIYDESNNPADATLQINDQEPINIIADRTLHYWSVSEYPIGETVFKIKCGTTTLELPVTVSKVEMDIEVTEGEDFFLTAANRSNTETEETREVWTYGDYSTEFTDFNWSSNGWINNALKLTGQANAYINYPLFGSDPKVSGLTIEIEFETHNVSNLNSTLISCYSENKGLRITSTEAIFNSEQEEVRARYREEERIRVSIVVENTNANRLIKTYINGVLSGLAQYSLMDNFQQVNPIGITLNQDKEQIDVHMIRVYHNALSSRSILNNYICDMTDVTEKISKYNSNNIYDVYGDVSYAKLRSMIPVFTITGTLPATKGDKKIVSTSFTDPVNAAMNFRYDDCEIDVQGTSSVYYPKKNYKVKFPESFGLYTNAIEEDTYTFKADYMESSHSHNTGNGVFINDLYDELFPTQTVGNNVRNTIYGFPCVIFYRSDEDSDYEYIGVYNFNNDKGNAATLGLTTDSAESWEFKNNTSLHCLLRDDNFSPENHPEDNFEARYPKDNTNYSNLQRVVSWIVSTENDLTKFREEFDQHFNLYYCLIYYVMMEFALMTDSRAKNMFFDTVDGEIWYPRFYDMDTCYGLNNEGVLGFGYGLEQHDGTTYNGRDSLFWNNFEQAYANEIKNMYISLRSSGKLNYDTIVKVYVDYQIDPICEANYNEDAYFKYIDPVVTDDNSTYLYTAQGNRLSHFKWWVTNRLSYLDSKYETSDYIANYLTMRLYTTNGNFQITPYIDEYVKGRFGSADVKERMVAGTAQPLNAPEGLVFSDTETIIYGASNISSIGDISNKYPGTVDVSQAVKLNELIIGSQESGYVNENMISLSLGNNTLLEKIDISNCPNLTGALDVSGCNKLKELYAAGTGITGINFVDGGDLDTLVLPSTITNLVIKNHFNLEQITGNISALQTLVLKNTKLDATDFLINNFQTLNRIYLKFDQDSNTTLDYYMMNYLLDHAKGIDDNDQNIDNPNIAGYLKVAYPSSLSTAYLQQLKDKYAQAFPNLTINWASYTIYYSYDSSNNRINMSTNVTMPSVIFIPTRTEIHNVLNINPLNENAQFRWDYHNTSTTYTGNIQTIILPEGYKNYYLNIGNFTNLTDIIIPENITFSHFDVGYKDYNYARTSSNIKDFKLKNVNIDWGLGQYTGTAYMFTVPKTTETITLENVDIRFYNGSSTQYLFAFYTSTSTVTDTNFYKLKKIVFKNITIRNPYSSSYKGLFTMPYYNYLCGDDIEFIIDGLTYIPTAGYNGAISNYPFNMSMVPGISKLTLRNIDWKGGRFYLSSYTGTSAGTGYQRLKEVYLENVNLGISTDISYFLAYHQYLENIQGLNRLNVSKITNMSYAFYYCYYLSEIDIKDWDWSSAINLSYMFCNCGQYVYPASTTHAGYANIKLPKTISIPTNMDYMFDFCGVKDLDLSTCIDWSKNTSLTYTFANMTNLNSLILPSQDPLELTNMAGILKYDRNSTTYGPTIKELDLSMIRGDKVTTLSSAFYRNLSCTFWSGFESIDLSNFTGQSLTYMTSTFYGQTVLTDLKISNINTSKVTSFEQTFYNCSSLDIQPIIQNFVTTAATTMAYMFYGCMGINGQLNLSHFNFDKVTTMAYIFSGCSNMIEVVWPDNVVFNSLTDASYMFANSGITSFNLSRDSFPNVTNMSYIFDGCKNLTSIDLSIFTNPKLTNISYALRNCTGLTELDFSGLDFSNITSASDFLTGCSGVTNIILNDCNVSKIGQSILGLVGSSSNFEVFDTTGSDMGTFSIRNWNDNYYIGAKNLKYLDMSGYTWSWSSYYSDTNRCYFFTGAPIEYLKLGKLTLTDYDTSHHPILRSLCAARPKMKEIDFTGINMGTCTDLSYLFYNDYALNKITWSDTFDVSTITTMAYMFYRCDALEEMIFPTTWKVDKVNTINNLFDLCYGLKKVVFGANWSKAIPTSTKYVFSENHELIDVQINNLNVSLVTDCSYTFYNCTGLKNLDLSAWKLPAATSCTYMFYGCTSLQTLNLSGLEWNANRSYTNFFYNCKNLQRLDIRKWNVAAITNSNNYSNMFFNVPNDCLIICKDESCRTWLKARNKNFNNIKLPSEL